MSPRPPEPSGVPSMGDVMQLPDAMRSLVLWLLRHGEAGLPELTAAAGLEEGPCRELVEALVLRGFLHGGGEIGAPRYRTHLTARRPRAQLTDLWDRLKD